MPYHKRKQRNYQRKWVAKRRADYFADKSCAKCNTTKKKLTLDHIDSTTKVDHKIWSWSAERRNAELAKCQVLCEDCHKEKTAQQLRVTTPEQDTMILKLAREGHSQRAIAEAVGVNRCVVRNRVPKWS